MRVFGHPLHAILVTFPLGLLSLTPLWDLLGWLGVTGAQFAGYWGQIGGLILGALALITGFIDFARLSKSAAVEKLGVLHAGGAATSLSVFAIALALRPRDHASTIPLIAIEFVGTLCLGFTGWAGGHLVFHHRVAVREDRN